MRKHKVLLLLCKPFFPGDPCTVGVWQFTNGSGRALIHRKGAKLAPETNDNDMLMQRYERLLEILRGYSSLAVAFSGGVDSSLLLAAARSELKERVVALTAESEVHPTGEKQMAIDLARRLDVRHLVFRSGELDDPIFLSNPVDRCYHCKKMLIRAMRDQMVTLGVTVLAHGVNVDDMSDFRPGMRAAVEMGVVAPLLEAGLTKADIRTLSKHLGLPNWNRPAMACLATRIPYGMPIDRKILRQIDQAEILLHQLGVEHCRVRHHGDLARIEVEAARITQLARPRIRKRLIDGMRALGYHHVCLDLEGYATGKMNRGIVREVS